MQHKLKSVFRRSSKSRSSSGSHENEAHLAKTSPPRSGRQRASSNPHGRTSVDSSATDSLHTGRSRPVSSIYDDSRRRASTEPDGLASPTDPNGGVIAKDYKAYLPALSPVNDDYGDDYISSIGDGHHITGARGSRHEEDVADRNIARYSTSFDGGHRSVTHSNTLFDQHQSRKESATSPSRPVRSPIRSNGHAEGYSGRQDNVKEAGTHIGTRSHKKTAPNEPQKRSSFPPGDPRVDAGIERKPLAPGSNKVLPQLPNETSEVQSSHSGVLYATVDGTVHGEETALARKLREDGVVNLTNTVDTDGNITWAPGMQPADDLPICWFKAIARSQSIDFRTAVTHEVIKPHQHEIIQHKIFREIHNYEYFHRIQPVRMTEVLPPRHWIPNPDGEGLIEISAEELPARTGDNRWWSICEHSSPQPPGTSLPKYRTEPEIIEAGTFITKEGLERKETIIIHPPTLADLTGYGGPVQAMHFDHKTGKSWMGELTTMDQLEQLQQELNRAPDAHAFKMNGLAESLPDVSDGFGRRGSNTVPSRKPVHGWTSPDHGPNRMSAAKASKF